MIIINSNYFKQKLEIVAYQHCANIRNKMKINFIIQSNKSIIWYKIAYASRYLQDADQTYTLLCETNMIFGYEI